MSGKKCKDCPATLTLKVNTYCSMCAIKRGVINEVSKRNVGRKSKKRG